MQQAQVCMIWTHTHTRTADHWQLTICVFSLCLPLCPCFSLSHTPSPSTRSLSFSHHVSLDGFSTCVQHSTTHSVTHPRGYWLVIYILYGSILYMITVCQHLTGFFPDYFNKTDKTESTEALASFLITESLARVQMRSETSQVHCVIYSFIQHSVIHTRTIHLKLNPIHICPVSFRPTVPHVNISLNECKLRIGYDLYFSFTNI